MLSTFEGVYTIKNTLQRRLAIAAITVKIIKKYRVAKLAKAMPISCRKSLIKHRSRVVESTQYLLFKSTLNQYQYLLIRSTPVAALEDNYSQILHVTKNQSGTVETKEKETLFNLHLFKIQVIKFNLCSKTFFITQFTKIIITIIII